VDEATGNTIFDEIMAFASYGFNKAHGVCYAVIAYQTAYLKRHYPREYFAALLTSMSYSTESVSFYIKEMRKIGIDVLPPSINDSDVYFTVEQDGIRYGLSTLKHVGRGLVREIAAQRKQDGPFTGFTSFCRRMQNTEPNRRALESLIHCGAFDGLGHTRRALAEAASSVLTSVSKDRQHNMAGQLGLFDSEEDKDDLITHKPEYDDKTRMSREKEVTGLYISGHPLQFYQNALETLQPVSFGELLRDAQSEEAECNRVYQDNQLVTFAGLVIEFSLKNTRKGEQMAFVTLEDESGSLEVMVFPKVLERCTSLIAVDRALWGKGKLSIREDRVQILADELHPLSQFAQHENDTKIPSGSPNSIPDCRLCVRVPSSGSPLFSRVRPMFDMFPGTMPYAIIMADTNETVSGECMHDNRLLSRLRELLGDANVVMQKRR
jgi:DNA polymerase-3 subunit alpha